MRKLAWGSEWCCKEAVVRSVIVQDVFLLSDGRLHQYVEAHKQLLKTDELIQQLLVPMQLFYFSQGPVINLH